LRMALEHPSFDYSPTFFHLNSKLRILWSSLKGRRRGGSRRIDIHAIPACSCAAYSRLNRYVRCSGRRSRNRIWCASVNIRNACTDITHRPYLRVVPGVYRRFFRGRAGCGGSILLLRVGRSATDRNVCHRHDQYEPWEDFHISSCLKALKSSSTLMNDYIQSSNNLVKHHIRPKKRAVRVTAPFVDLALPRDQTS